MSAAAPATPDRIDLWSVRLSDVWSAQGDPAHLLSPGERARAAAMPGRAAARFVAARAAMRTILAPSAGLAPAELVFACGPAGKPRLANGPQGLEFSLAHGGDLALCAVAWGRAVGVDLEPLRPVPAALALAAELLDRATMDALRRLAPPARSRAFLVAWTRHEALVKARGDGLAGAWPPAAGTAGAAALSASGLRVRELALPAGHVGALASTGSLTLRHRAFQPQPMRPARPSASLAAWAIPS